METVKCPHCGKEYSKKGIGTHIWRNHGEGKNHEPFGDSRGWAKGLTKDTDPRVKKSSEALSKATKGKPNPAISEEAKKKISDSMKIAHQEGRAHNIGSSRWNNEPSYPEKFFVKVIENEFDDKNYVREYPLGVYSIDFAWPHKKLAIEIDGQQHERFEEYKQRDNRKDEYLRSQGWDILRVRWTNMFHEPKKYIKDCKDFIARYPSW